MGDARHPLVGTVVKSVSGRDKKRIFVVVGVSGDPESMRLAVVNGQLRTTDRPKLKNPRHVRPVGHLTEQETERLLESMDDGLFQEILASWDPKTK